MCVIWLAPGRYTWAENFSRGAADEFKIDVRDVGKVSQVEVSHDGRGRSPSWHLEVRRAELGAPGC